ncbi:hypothetical protein TWF281_008125 [Arthrobotrys megalospora]
MGAFDRVFDHLVYVKEKKTGTGVIEIHIANGSKNFTEFLVHSGTPFPLSDPDTGYFLCAAAKNNEYDLIYIKTKSTGTGKIELHRLSAASGYKGFTKQLGTAFDVSEGNNGTFLFYGGLLYFVKYRNTGSGKVELHRCGYRDDSYSKVDISWVTGFSPDEASHGTWCMGGLTGGAESLHLIKTSNTGSGKIEIHTWSGPRSGISIEETGFNIGEGWNGTFHMGSHSELYFVKSANMGSGKIEVHCCNALGDFPWSKRYQNIDHRVSAYPGSDAAEGKFLIVKSTSRA